MGVDHERTVLLSAAIGAVVTGHTAIYPERAVAGVSEYGFPLTWYAPGARAVELTPLLVDLAFWSLLSMLVLQARTFYIKRLK